MSIGVVLETAIGLMFVYLILGLIASALQEVFAAITKLRGKYLLEGLSRLLADKNGAIWRARNYMVGRTLANVPEPAPQPTGTGKAKAPAIPASSDAAGSVLFTSVVNHPLIADSGGKAAPSYVTNASFYTALTDELRRAGAALANPPKDPGPRLLAEIEAGIESLPPGPAKTALAALLTQSLRNLDAFKSKVEAWFDTGMERVSGVYKRFTKYFALGFGIVIAIGLNVDSLRIAEHLWRDPAARAAVVAAAEEYVANAIAADESAPPPEPSEPLPAAAGDAAAAGNTPVAGGEPAPAPAAGQGGELDAVGQAVGNLANTIEIATSALEELALPFGWNQDNPWTPLSILGWLLTALAVSLGAPFWFDLLKKVMRIRAAGNAPDETPVGAAGSSSPPSTTAAIQLLAPPVSPS